MRTDLLGGAMLAAAVVGAVLVLRRRAVEKRFTLYSSAARWEEALPYAKSLAGFLAPGDVKGRRQMNLGKILARLGRRDEARLAFEEALATQVRAGDPYASLTRLGLAELELHARRPDKAREHAATVARDSEDLRPRARALIAAASLVAGDRAGVQQLLGTLGAELRASKRPGDALALAVLAASLDDPARASELGALARERIPLAQREEVALQVPELKAVLGVS